MAILKRIHVDQHRIRANVKTGGREPPISIKTGSVTTKASRADILDVEGNVVASVIYSPDKPLSCGARVWIETKNEVRACG